jgi:hypothetical protein
MSGKPTGVLILAILQLIGALLNLWAGALLIMAAMLLGPFAFLFAFPALILFIVGLIGLIQPTGSPRRSAAHWRIDDRLHWIGWVHSQPDCIHIPITALH